MIEASHVSRLPYRAMSFGGLVSALILGGCLFGHDDKASSPTVSILTPANGSTVTGPDLFVKVKTTNFKFLSAGAGKVSLAQATVSLAEATVSLAQQDDDHLSGHIHLYLDKPSGLDADAIKRLNKSDTVTITGVAPGVHYLIVQGADANHADLASMRDSVKFTVAAP